VRKQQSCVSNLIFLWERHFSRLIEGLNYEPTECFSVFISLVCLHEAVVTATVGAIVAPTGCSRRQPALHTTEINLKQKFVSFQSTDDEIILFQFWEMLKRFVYRRGLSARLICIASLGFVINRFFIKLFKTNSTETVKACQEFFFGFQLYPVHNYLNV